MLSFLLLFSFVKPNDDATENETIILLLNYNFDNSIGVDFHQLRQMNANGSVQFESIKVSGKEPMSKAYSVLNDKLNHLQNQGYSIVGQSSGFDNSTMVTIYTLQR